MPEEIGLFEAIDSQRAIRLYRADPVPQELIERVIEAGIRAPSSGNRQKWGFVIVRDTDLKLRIAAYYRSKITPGISTAGGSADVGRDQVLGRPSARGAGAYPGLHRG
ncbi:MAG: nitroreductase family protein [Dehalococcoidia bacterium]|nr:nitroreductase family protein [Dehalococcoidia bacterium]